MNDTIDATAADATVSTPGRLSARVFAFDRIVAVASAAVMTLGSIPLARLLGWPTWIVLAIGVALLPYGFMLHSIVRAGAYRSLPAHLSAVADGMWVLASVALLIGWPDATSTVGTWIVAAQAVVVADIGLLKLLGWRRS